MKVLIFSLSYFPMVGGAEVAVKEITDRIPDVEFDMVTLRFDTSHKKEEKVGNITVYRIGGGLGYLSKILFIPQAAFFALRKKHDLHWAIMTYMLFPVSIARLLGGKTPYVLTLQDGDPFTHVFNRLRILFFKPLLSYGFKHATKVQAISSYLAQWAKQIGYKEEVEVIGNGVDFDKFKRAEGEMGVRDGVTLITTSRLVEKNGVGDVIDALALLPSNVRFKILGSGPLEDDLKAKVRDLDLSERVEFLDFVPQPDLPQHLHQADIFIRASLSEGFGNSFIEAMAAGLPVIATPVGGIVDFIKDGETGVFCEPQNPESIAGAVAKILNDESLRQRLVENGRKLAQERYDWNLIAREMRGRVFQTI